MDRNKTVAGLDVHKDSIYLCIMGYDKAFIFEKTYGCNKQIFNHQILVKCNHQFKINCLIG